MGLRLGWCLPGGTGEGRKGAEVDTGAGIHLQDYGMTPLFVNGDVFTVKPEGSERMRVSQFEFRKNLPMKTDPDIKCPKI